MKVRLEVSSSCYEQIKRDLEACGIEVDDNAEYVLSQNNTYTEYLVGKREESTIHVAVEDIVFIETLGHDVMIYTEEGAYKSSARLWQLEKSLDPECFVRISNSTIIAKNRVKRIKVALSQKFTLTLSNGKLVDVTRTYYYAFKEKFGL